MRHHDHHDRVHRSGGIRTHVVVPHLPQHAASVREPGRHRITPSPAWARDGRADAERMKHPLCGLAVAHVAKRLAELQRGERARSDRLLPHRRICHGICHASMLQGTADGPRARTSALTSKFSTELSGTGWSPAMLVSVALVERCSSGSSLPPPTASAPVGGGLHGVGDAHQSEHEYALTRRCATTRRAPAHRRASAVSGQPTRKADSTIPSPSAPRAASCVGPGVNVILGTFGRNRWQFQYGEARRSQTRH
eukprot:SAG11_NODE_1883_length_4124_cov_7.056149_3_plen_252_part_00